MADEEKFKCGDVVRLKSGGPKMTVTDCEMSTSEVLTVWVTWFDGKGNSANGTYPVAAVELM